MKGHENVDIFSLCLQRFENENSCFFPPVTAGFLRLEDEIEDEKRQKETGEIAKSQEDHESWGREGIVYTRAGQRREGSCKRS